MHTDSLVFPDKLSPAAFLAGYWQKRPLLMRQALPGYRNPLQPDELAGLACEAGVESRIVLEKDGVRPWEARHGPFEEADFAAELERHGWLLRSGYTRIAFCHGKDGWDHLFVNGREFGLSSGSKAFLHAITQEHRLHHGYLAEWLEEPECLDLLCRLYNEGYYEFADA